MYCKVHLVTCHVSMHVHGKSAEAGAVCKATTPPHPSYPLLGLRFRRCLGIRRSSLFTFHCISFTMAFSNVVGRHGLECPMIFLGGPLRTKLIQPR